MSDTDLKKALAQARKEVGVLKRRAQIEAALECVRTRTRTMHHSDELAETAVLVFQQFEALGMLPAQARTFITLIDTDHKCLRFSS